MIGELKLTPGLKSHTLFNTPLLPKYQYHVIDRCLRGASDIISCETTNVHSNTASLIQWCKLWSNEALFTYRALWEELTERRNGKPPTHRMVCNERDQNRTRYFTCEHEYPMVIPKRVCVIMRGLFNKLKIGCGLMARLQLYLTQKMIDYYLGLKIWIRAARRYSDAGIIVCEHPHHRRL